MNKNEDEKSPKELSDMYISRFNSSNINCEINNCGNGLRCMSLNSKFPQKRSQFGI